MPPYHWIPVLRGYSAPPLLYPFCPRWRRHHDDIPAVYFFVAGASTRSSRVHGQDDMWSNP